MILLELLIVLSTIFPLFHLLNALISMKPRRKKHPEMPEEPERAFSVLIPCYNEQDTVGISVRGMLNMDYSNFEAIYINDGSRDDTLKQLDTLLCLKKLPEGTREGYTVYQSEWYGNFFVIDKPNSGKSSALNAGVEFAKSDLVVTLDADSVMERGALKIMSAAFSDPNVMAVGGSIHIMQGYLPEPVLRKLGRKRLVMIALQMLEYLKGFYIYKFSLACQNATAIISGAFGAFRKKVVQEVGGFRKTLGEDIDITIKIQRHIHNTKGKVLYLPEALCTTQCPESLRDLKRQRIRWQKGFVDCLRLNLKFLCKTCLTKSLSFHLVVEAFVVGLVSCSFTLMTLPAAVAFVFISPVSLENFALFQAICVFMNLLYSVCALVVSARYHCYPKEAWKLLVAAIALDVLWFRYFTLLMYLGGTVSYFWARRNRHNWNKVARSKPLLDAYNIRLT